MAISSSLRVLIAKVTTLGKNSLNWYFASNWKKLSEHIIDLESQRGS